MRAFELYDTYGFPVDLTRLIANEKGLAIDEAGFEAEMRKQKNRSRAATTIESEDWIILKQGSTSFVGYDQLETVAHILRYRKVKIKDRSGYQLVLDSTAFYPEGGGQVGDTGILIQPLIGEESAAIIKVIDTKRENDLIIHFTETLPRDTGAQLIARVDAVRRRSIQMHHSATHLVHAALRKVLGAHVAQKGSLVNEEHLRFDFSHIAKMTVEEITRTESMVNERIRENIPVVIKQLPRDQALQMGAMALFGEKYGETVRVVIMDPNYSIELCGGTHIGSTGELGIFKIKSEMAVAAGVRRIEAVTGKQAETYITEQLDVLHNIREMLKHPKNLEKAIEGWQDDNAELKKRIDHLEARQLVGLRNELLHKDEIINGVTFVGEIIEVSNPDALKKLCFELKNKLNDHVAVLCSNIDGKAYVAIGISEKVVAARKLDAGKIIKEAVAPLIKGGGGGQKTLATAGGQDVGSLPEVIAKVKALL